MGNVVLVCDSPGVFPDGGTSWDAAAVSDFSFPLEIGVDICAGQIHSDMFIGIQTPNGLRD